LLSGDAPWRKFTPFFGIIGDWNPINSILLLSSLNAFDDPDDIWV